MNRKPQAKASFKNLAKAGGSQQRLHPQVVGKSLSKKELPTFHTRSMIEFEEEEPRDFRTSHQTSIVETNQKNKLNFVVALPQKNSTACGRKSPVAKYVRKDPCNNTSSSINLNLRSTLKNISKMEATKESRDANTEIILQLRQTIEQMRQKQTKYEEDLQRLRKVNERLEHQNRQLIETLKKYELRDRELCQKLRDMEGDRCVDHEIIIQSLKKVIDGQLQKIIELERQKITAESCSLRSSKTAETLDYLAHESTPSFPPSSPHPRLKEILQRVTEEVASYTSDEEDQNRPPSPQQHQQLDTFRKKPSARLELQHDRYRTDDILQQIDNCLDSLSRRKRQLM